MATVVAPDIPGMSDWQPLARGGFATVWRARQDALDRLVAIKVDERRLDSATERRRFLGEAKAAGNLSGHPAIVTVHDAGILGDGRPYLVMKLFTGGSLTAWLRPDNRQTPARICAVGMKIADALAVVHEKGLLHRDIKPPNILIDSYGNPGLTDFGLAAPGSGHSTGLTLAFAPPEVLLGQPHTAAGDVYQLAATLYALLSGRPPSEVQGSSTSLADRVARLRRPVEPLPGIDPKLMQLLRDGLAFAPADRPTAAQFRDRLAALDLLRPDGRSGAGSTAAKRPASTRRVVLGLVAITVVSLLVLAFGASGVYLYEIDRSVTANINREIDLPPEVIGTERRPVKDPVAAKTLQYLLIGTDAGDPAYDRDGRSDSLMLLHLNEARDHAYVISFPRNLMVPIPGQGRSTRRINTAMNGGAPLVVRTLEQLTQARIDHVAMVDFRGFVNLTQDLEGVTVRNRYAFDSHGYHYPVGDITLSGDAALWYVREGRNLPSELYRAENQRNVLKAILAKGLSPEVVADPLQFTQFVGNAAKQVRVDKTLSDGELRSTAASLRLTPSDITLITAPLGKERRANGQPVYDLDRAQLGELTKALRTDTMAAYVKKYPKG